MKDWASAVFIDEGLLTSFPRIGKQAPKTIVPLFSATLECWTSSLAFDQWMGEWNRRRAIDQKSDINKENRQIPALLPSCNCISIVRWLFPLHLLQILHMHLIQTLMPRSPPNPRCTLKWALQSPLKSRCIFLLHCFCQTWRRSCCAKDLDQWARISYPPPSSCCSSERTWSLRNQATSA